MKQLILFLIRLYQSTARYLLKPIFRTFFPADFKCRFSPTCSDYTYQAVEKYGVIKGLYVGIKRIARCHPWDKGGFDPLH
jgi:putative membrane protein insertion efficiency factor